MDKNTGQLGYKQEAKSTYIEKYEDQGVRVYHQVPDSAEVQGVCLFKQDWIFIIWVQLQPQQESQLRLEFDENNVCYRGVSQEKQWMKTKLTLEEFRIRLAIKCYGTWLRRRNKQEGYQ